MKRILLKLSGEALAGEKKTGFDEATCIGVAKQVKQLVDDGIQVAIVTGGGNFWRGRTSETIDRTKADQIGMAGELWDQENTSAKQKEVWLRRFKDLGLTKIKIG